MSSLVSRSCILANYFLDANSGNITLSDTFDNFHDYEIRWTPEKIEWLVDGKVGRTQLKKDTWNSTSKNWEFPQTPSRLQLSIWPGGLASNAKGTIDWAGGEMDWDHQDIKNTGYFYATFNSVEIECYNADSAPGTNKGKSYWYEDARGTNDTIVDGDRDTVLASLQGTGTDMDKGKKKDKPSKSASASKTEETEEAEETEVASIPGGGTGGSGNDHSDEDDSSNDQASNVPGGGVVDNGGDDGDDTTQADTSNCDTSSFNQDCGKSDNSNSNSDNGRSGSTRTSASALAIIIAGCAVYWL